MQPHPLDPHPEVRLVPVSPRVTAAYGPVTGGRWQANATIVVGDRATLGDPAVRDAYAGMAARLGGDPAAFAMPEVDVAFDPLATIDLGGVTLEGVSVGPGHSDSDTLWWCPEERIAWSGDQVFHGAFPLVRTNLDHWFTGLDRLAAWGPFVVVPGHGPLAGPEVLDDQRRLLEVLVSEVGDLLRCGATVGRRGDGMTHHVLDASETHAWFDRDDPARLEIDPGDTVTFELREPLDGQMSPETKVADLLAIDGSRSHSLLGPVPVRGAQAGDALEVEILEFAHRDEGRGHDDEGLHSTGEGLSETQTHSRYEAIALRNDLARQLEGAVATVRAWARSDDSPEADAVADALGEIFDRVGTPSESVA